MPQVLAELSLSAEIRTALSGVGGAFGNVYETLFAYEKADWNELSRIGKNSGYSEDAIPDCLVVASTRPTAFTC
jgi:c-di-GMP-related signal transduction protein